MTAPRVLRTRAIVWFWFPLAATWFMMSAEGPYIAAIIAHLPEAAFNLAAYGVAFSVAWVVESPIIMLLTAGNTLVHGRRSFLAVRRFMYTMNALLTACMAIVVTPPVFRFVTLDVMQLPEDIAHLAQIATAFLLLWPAAIGYRRFYQGVLVRHGLTRRVAYGTVLRLTTMSLVAAALAFRTAMHGATIGAVALACGVIAEAVASRWMARHVVASLLAAPESESDPPLTQRAIMTFYYPLALTSMIWMITAPLLTLFMGRAKAPVESLAVLPVVQGLLFVFRGGGVAYQEVGVALTGRQHEHEREIGRVSVLLGVATTMALALLLFTPLADVWLRDVSGLPIALASFALVPAQILVLMPASEYWLSFQRSRYIINGATGTITSAAAVEVAAIGLVLYVCVSRLGMTGAIAASVAMMTGRVVSNLFLQRGMSPR